MPEISISPTSLSQYIKFDNCERFLRLNLAKEDRKRLLKRWRLTIQPLTPLLKEAGSDFEKETIEKILPEGSDLIDLSEKKDLQETLHVFKNIKKPALLTQAYLSCSLNGIPATGQADLIHLTREKNGALNIHVSDFKATRKEKTEHRVQVATYAKMIQQITATNAIPVNKFTVSVLTFRDDGIYPKLNVEKSTFDLETYFGVLVTLLFSENSVVTKVLSAPFDSLFFHLSYKCDGCFYNSICMFDAAENHDLCLVPHITPVEKRVFLSLGIRKVNDLASLMDFPPDDQKTLVPVQGKEEVIEKIHSQWPIGANLPYLIQRAKGALHTIDKNIASNRFLINSGFGTLPSDEQYPDLVKIFIDAQRDYLKDRVYLLSAFIRSPRGEKSVIRIAQTVSDDESEKDLLIEWIGSLLLEVYQLAPSESVPIHFYCFSRTDQKVLLEALKRHLSSISLIPAFFDLLTQSPALSQSMISFLSDEIKERFNTGRICSPLHNAASFFGFNWRDERYDYYNLFRARIFDNRRRVIRNKKGIIEKVGKNEEAYFNIESASRFNSQIPLEYAYAAWGLLPEASENSELLDPFRNISFQSLLFFAEKRVQALSHIESSIRFKSRRVEKIPLQLSDLVNPEEGFSFARSLKEFLHMEHHTVLQTNLISYSLPIEQRVQDGIALLLEFQRQEGDQFSFKPIFSEIGLLPDLAFNANKMKEGDWVVFNEIDPTPSPNQLKHGRLAIIKEFSKGKIKLDLLGINFQNGKFRYFHRQLSPEIGKRYSIDPMSDDLNADKFLDALDNTSNNLFFQWLVQKPSDYPIEQKREDFHNNFIKYINELLKNRKRKLTEKQADAISAHSKEPLLLIQGPPGTGKSYTLAWVLQTRMACSAVIGRPFRILISCKTHNAINVELKEIAQANRMIGGFAPQSLGGMVFSQQEILKVGNEGSDPVPEGVKGLNPYQCSQSKLQSLLNEQFIIIGATPGGVYNLIKRASGRSVDWDFKPFDLVVIDEASQMSLPESVLAGAFLKKDGYAIIVGDHRQMPPIISHPWEEEQKRTVSESQPFISLFEFLSIRDFPCIRLDESFRLHKELAEFLRENVYSKDGINFHSKRKEIIPQIQHSDEYINAALNPDCPIVVIEHEEQKSQQYNLLELELARPIINTCVNHLSLDGRNGIGVVVPHRAQKALLRSEFPELASVNSIDTVERFQGDERDVIIVSATASDPDYVLNEADFLLNLNRLNVAISRPRKKLIVIASKSVIDLLVSDLEIFDQSVIWKRLFRHYTPNILFESEIEKIKFSVRGRDSFL